VFCVLSDVARENRYKEQSGSDADVRLASIEDHEGKPKYDLYTA
jgi:hypothetical protein